MRGKLILEVVKRNPSANPYVKNKMVIWLKKITSKCQSAWTELWEYVGRNTVIFAF